MMGWILFGLMMLVVGGMIAATESSSSSPRGSYASYESIRVYPDERLAIRKTNGEERYYYE